MVERFLQGLLMIFLGIVSVFLAGIYPALIQDLRREFFKKEPDEREEYWDTLRCVVGGYGAILYGIGIWLGVLSF